MTKYVDHDHREAVVRAAFDEGRPLSTAADQLGVSHDALRKWVRKNMGRAVELRTVPLRRDLQRRRGHLSPEESAHRMEVVEAGLAAGTSINQFARDLGISPEALRNWMRRAQLPDRPEDVIPARTREDLPTPADITRQRRARLTGKAY